MGGGGAAAGGGAAGDGREPDEDVLRGAEADFGVSAEALTGVGVAAEAVDDFAGVVGEVAGELGERDGA